MTLQHSLGHISHDASSSRRTDYLYRISLKGLIKNDAGEVLVVKEMGRDWWDLPGGGMDHGEDIKLALAREMREEVNMEGDFTYRIIAVDEPMYLEKHNFWQLRLIFEITPENMIFSAGDDSDEISFMQSKLLGSSDKETERRVYTYDKASLKEEKL